jgi:hypothetical protein
MASTWRKAAANLSCIALTQFDAQLQESIRYDLGPRVLLPAVLGLSPDQITARWRDGTYYPDARQIATQWIEREWPTYVWISGCHLWGTLTMANFMDTADRMSVWAALSQVAASTWGDRPMRTDYPLNRIDKPLKWSTDLIYRAIRYASILMIVLGLISTIIVMFKSSYNSKLFNACLAAALAVAWCVAHSIPAGMLVFPEFRYTYANLLVLISGGAAWLAHVIPQRKTTVFANTVSTLIPSLVRGTTLLRRRMVPARYSRTVLRMRRLPAFWVRAAFCDLRATLFT